MRYQALSIIVACLSLNISSLSHAQNNPHNATSHQHQVADMPLRYRIAPIDPRFNLSSKQVLELTQQAAKIWEEETGKKHFIYDPNAEFTINLVYDDRQQHTSNRLQSLNQLKQQQQQWEIDSLQIQQVKDEIQRATASIASKQSQLTAQFQQYNADVQRFNQMRSSSKEWADQLAQRQKQLQQQSAELKQAIQQHSQKTQQLNQQIKGLNQNNQQLALSAHQFNQTFQPRLFHKGQFNGKQISVYEFSSKDDLRMTLAHEFGHALGLDHTDDPTSLMYPVIQKQNMERFALAHADQQELVRAVN